MTNRGAHPQARTGRPVTTFALALCASVILAACGTTTQPPTEPAAFEEVLPDEVGGVEVHKTTVPGPEIPSREILAIVQAAGGSVEDSEAVIGRVGGAESPVTVFAVRAPGVDAAAFRAAVTEAATSPLSDIIGDKEVLTEDSGENGLVYHYFYDDVWFNIVSDDPAAVEEVLETLP